MSNLLDKMMSKNDLNAPPAKLDVKRAELASAITKTFLNKHMPDIKAALGQVEIKGEKPE